MDIENNQKGISGTVSVKGLHRPGDERTVGTGASGRKIVIVAGERAADGTETFYMTDGFCRMVMKGFES